MTVILDCPADAGWVHDDVLDMWFPADRLPPKGVVTIRCARGWRIPTAT